jgi:hypothetical protein
MSKVEVFAPSVFTAKVRLLIVTQIVRSPVATGDFARHTVTAFLQSLADRSFTGVVEFEPSNLKLRFLEGDLIGAAGGEPLGSILVRRGDISEAQLVLAIEGQQRRSLGEILTKPPFSMPSTALVSALETQIMLAVNLLLSELPATYAVFEENLERPEHAPRVSLKDALNDASSAAAEVEAGVLALNAVLRMRLQSLKMQVQLTSDQWDVCALLNGRRSLEKVMRHFEVTHLSIARESARMRAYRAAVQLFQLGLIEPAAINGLQTLVMRKLNVPRSGINARAAVFLDALDGVKSVYRLAQELKIELTDASSIVTNLYRNNFAAVAQGKRELERLLEEY